MLDIFLTGKTLPSLSLYKLLVYVFQEQRKRSEAKRKLKEEMEKRAELSQKVSFLFFNTGYIFLTDFLGQVLLIFTFPMLQIMFGRVKTILCIKPELSYYPVCNVYNFFVDHQQVQIEKAAEKTFEVSERVMKTFETLSGKSISFEFIVAQML